MILGGSNDPQIDGAGLARNRGQFALFDHPQQFPLQCGRHAVDLVQEKRAAVRIGDPPALEPIAEQRLVGDGVRQSRAVHCHEAPGATCAPTMQQLRDELLAGAGLAFDQHVDVDARQLADGLAQPNHDGCLAEQRQALFGLGGGQAQATIFQDQAPHLERAAHAGDHVIGGKWLCDEIERALLQCSHCHGDIAMTRHQDHREFRIAGQSGIQHAMPIHARHADIGDEDARKVGVQARQRGVPVTISFDIQPGDCKRIRQRDTKSIIVIDKHYA